MTDRFAAAALPASAAGGVAAGTAAAPHPAAAGPRDAAGARRVAEDFESFFFTQSLESMYAGLSTNGLFGGGSGESVYRSLLLQEYGKAAARGGGLGIADSVQRQILKLQEVAS